MPRTGDGRASPPGSAQAVRDYLPHLLYDLDSANGGSWLYIEIDPGLKWENVQALFEFAPQLRL